MTDWKKEADGIELRTTRGEPPHIIVVRRKDLHALVLRAVEETKKETIKQVMNLVKGMEK